MAHKCVCAVCQRTFDRDKVQAVRFNGRRYAHAECFPEGELVPLAEKKTAAEDPELTELKEYINTKFGDKCNWAMTQKHIRNFKEQGMSYSGMKKTLMYFFDVKGNSIEKANNSIGIIPYVYQEAFQYYYDLHKALKANEGADKILTHQVREIEIKSPRARIKPPRMFKFWEDEEEDYE